MAIPEEHTFAREDVFPSWFANAMQKFLATAAPSFQLSRLDATHIQVVAGTEQDAAMIAINGAWRWNEATVSRAHPGGASGTWDIFAVAAKDVISSSPVPGTDNTVRAFDLRIVKAGETPSIEPGVVDIFRKVGSLTWTGTAISSVVQSLGHRSEVVYPVGPQLSLSTTRAPVGGEWIQLAGGGGPVMLPDPATPNRVIGVAHTGLNGEVEVSAPIGEVWTLGKTVKLLSGETIVLRSDGTSWIVESIRRRTWFVENEKALGFNEDHIPSTSRAVEVMLTLQSNKQAPIIEAQLKVGSVKRTRIQIVGEEAQRLYTWTFTCAPNEAWRVDTGGGFLSLVASYRILGHE